MRGITKTGKILCDALGIWCMIAISEANPEKNIKLQTCLEISSGRKESTVTWMPPLTIPWVLGTISGMIILTSPRQRLFRDHEPVLYKAPPLGSEGNLFYYLVKSSPFTKTEGCGKRALQAIKKKT